MFYYVRIHLCVDTRRVDCARGEPERERLYVYIWRTREG